MFLYVADIKHFCDFMVLQVTSTFYTISARKDNYKFSSLENFKVGGSLDHVHLLRLCPSCSHILDSEGFIAYGIYSVKVNSWQGNVMRVKSYQIVCTSSNCSLYCLGVSYK